MSERVSFEANAVTNAVAELDAAVRCVLDALCAVGAEGSGALALTHALTSIHEVRALLDGEAWPEGGGDARARGRKGGPS